MHLGIDLGTTNSAVAAHIDGRVRVCKSEDDTDVFPSVIFQGKRGGKLYGARAYNQLATSPDNVASGFKRQMGTSWRFTFADTGGVMTAEECSAEILQQLLAQAVTETGHDDITGVVITIPAVSNQLRLEATKRAAELAGISRVALLQEPVAAAMAALAQSKNKDTRFLVYDLGGGTLDLALVQSNRGSISIIGRDGNDMFGGREFDRMIVNEWARPWLEDNFALPGDFSAKHKTLGHVRFAAEKAKIRLSSRESAEIVVLEDDLRMRDAEGEDIFVRIPVTRADYEDLISERIEESVDLARKLLKDHGFSGADMDKIVFIGGPSKTPMVRETVSRELGIPADMSVDPMTAVAVGAAIFCESRDWSNKKESTRKKTRAREVVEGAAGMEIIFPARVSESRAQIRLRPSDETAQKGFQVQMDSDEGWASGWLPLNGEVRIDEVPVGREGDNMFRLLVTDSNRIPVEGAEKKITITRTAASVAVITAMHAIAVKVAVGEGDQAANTLHTFVEKGSELPDKGIATYHAAKNVGGDGGADRFSVELFEQPDASNKTVGGPNLYIGNYVIRREDLGGAVITMGDKINIHWRQDESGLLTAAVEVPSLGQTFDSRNFYSFELAANRRVFGGEKGRRIVMGMLSAAQKEVKEALKVASEEQKEEIRKLENELAKQKATLESDDKESQQGVDSKVREIRQKLFALRNDPQNNARRLRHELREAKKDFAKRRPNADSADVNRFDELAQNAEEAIERGDEDAKNMLEEMQRISTKVYFSLPEGVKYLFRWYSSRPGDAIDSGLFNSHVRQGKAALANGDFGELRRINGAMRSNRISAGGGTKAKEPRTAADITR